MLESHTKFCCLKQIGTTTSKSDTLQNAGFWAGLKELNVACLCLAITRSDLWENVYDALHSYLEENALFYLFQSGTLKFHSTETVLICLTALIDHKTLFAEFKAFRIESRELIDSYLTDRRQFVDIDGCKSFICNPACYVWCALRFGARFLAAYKPYTVDWSAGSLAIQQRLQDDTNKLVKWSII